MARKKKAKPSEMGRDTAMAFLMEGFDAGPPDRVIGGKFPLGLHCPQAETLALLDNWLGPFFVDNTTPAKSVTVIHDDGLETEDRFLEPFLNFPREPGIVSFTQEAAISADDCRIINNTRSCFCFFQSGDTLIARGDCVGQMPVLVDFLRQQSCNAQWQQGAAVLRGAAMRLGDKGLLLAGPAASGRSALMCQALNSDAAQVISDDLVLLDDVDGVAQLSGLPTVLQANIGACVNNPSLHSLVESERREILADLKLPFLWEMQEPYSVDTRAAFGRDCFEDSCGLDHILYFDWQPGSDAPLSLCEASAEQRESMCRSINKHAGVFYQSVDGDWLQEPRQFDCPALKALEKTPFSIVSGGIDMQALLQKLGI